MLVVKMFFKLLFALYIDFSFYHRYIKIENDVRVAENGIE